MGTEKLEVKLFPLMTMGERLLEVTLNNEHASSSGLLCGSLFFLLVSLPCCCCC